jgi:phospholipase/carboxylesterase
MSESDAVVIEPPQQATASVIWLHGLGADGHDFEPVVPCLGELTRHTRFLFPHAPHRPVTINGGYVMRAWYDIVDPDLARRADVTGVYAAEDRLSAYLTAEIRAGIPSERIVIAGFSQGGAVALHAGVRHTDRLAGILALSTYFAVPLQRPAVAPTTPVFMGHGSADPVIPLSAGEAARDWLTAAGYGVTWRSYPVGHGVCPDEIRDVALWLAAVIA